MTGRRKEVPGMSEGGVYSGEGPTDNCLRPSRRHSSPSCQHRAKLFKVFASIACGRRGRAGPSWGPEPSGASRATGQAGGAGRRRLQAPHSRWPLPVRLRLRSAPEPTTLRGPFPTCAPRTTLGASENVTSGTRPAPPPAAGLGVTVSRT